MSGLKPLNYANYLGVAVDVSTKITHEATRKTRAKPTPYHKGWQVVGYRRSDVLSAEKAAADELNLFNSLDSSARAAYGIKAPKPFNESTYLSSHRPSIASRQYGVKAAAEEFAGMLMKTGEWLRVQVKEVKRD